MIATGEFSRRAFLASGIAAGFSSLTARSAVAASDCSSAPDLKPIKPHIERAVSLRQVTEALAAGKPARLEGLTRLDGYVVDKDNNDVLLIGLSERDQPELQTADFCVALRSAFLRGIRDGTNYDKSAAISIDPNPDVFRELREIKVWRPEEQVRYVEVCKAPQTVRVDGMARHTRVASILVAADYRMKQVGQGTIKLPISSPFLGDFDAVLTDWRAELAAGRDPNIPASLTRYWFTPGRFNYIAAAEGADTVFLEFAEVVLKDEAQMLQPGAAHAVASGEVNKYARTFTCAWTDRMEDTYKSEPIWRDMHNMYRHFAIARTMYDRDVFDRVTIDIQFLLERYKLPYAEVPDTLAGLSRIATYKRDSSIYARTVCGGVQVGFMNRIPSSAAHGDEVERVGRNAIAVRPTKVALAWPTPDSLRGAFPPPSAPRPTTAPAPIDPTARNAPRSIRDLFGSGSDDRPKEAPPLLRDLFKS